MPPESFADHIRSLDAGELRTVTRYDGDEWETVFRSDQVEEAYSEEAFDSITKHLVLKSFDDNLEQPELAQFGHLDATVRWFHNVVVVQVPLDDWSGVIVSLERDSTSDTSTLVDGILDYVTDVHDDPDSETVADDLANQFDQ